jgi:hypothetical protein
VTPEPRRHEERLECTNCGAYVVHRCPEPRDPGDDTPPRLAGPGSTPAGRAAARQHLTDALNRRRQEHQP